MVETGHQRRFWPISGMSDLPPQAAEKRTSEIGSFVPMTTEFRTPIYVEQVGSAC